MSNAFFIVLKIKINKLDCISIEVFKANAVLYIVTPNKNVSKVINSCIIYYYIKINNINMKKYIITYNNYTSYSYYTGCQN